MRSSPPGSSTRPTAAPTRRRASGPVDRLPLEGLTPFSSAKPWRFPEPPARPKGPSFRFAEAPVVETRSLAVYEEVSV